MIILNIKECRKAKEVTLEELAEYTGISISYLSEIECNESNPTLENLEKIALALEICIKQLIDGCDHLHCKNCDFIKYHKYKLKRK